MQNGWYFIRHGPKEYDNGKGIPRFDPKIIEKDFNFDIKNFLPASPDLVLTSPYLRCRSTSSLIYPDIIPNICKHIREYLGYWKYYSKKDFNIETWNYICNYDTNIQESSLELKKRLQNFISELDHSKNIVIITHGYCLDIIYGLFSKSNLHKISVNGDQYRNGFKVTKMSSG